VESLFAASLHISDFVQTQNEAKILTIIESGVVVGHSEARGTNLGRDNYFGPINEREGCFTGQGSDSGSVRPEHFGDIFNPSSFLLLKLFLQCPY
jgi:hypothetical protein